MLITFDYESPFIEENAFLERISDLKTFTDDFNSRHQTVVKRWVLAEFKRYWGVLSPSTPIVLDDFGNTMHDGVYCSTKFFMGVVGDRYCLITPINQVFVPVFHVEQGVRYDH